MGQQYSQPEPGAKLQVICAGLPRTGTASLSAALEILLKGPVYHGGTQMFNGSERDIKTAIEILNHWPTASEGDDATSPRHAENLRLLDSLVGEGYVAVADSPAATLVPELLELYPDARVLCTTRDVGQWERSMEGVSSAATLWFLRAVLWPLPTMRWTVDYMDALRRQWVALYGESEPPTRRSYDRHIEWMREVVPRERLFLVDVKDGWRPLCRALDVPVPPEDVKFPHVNDGKAIEEFAEKQVARGLKAWLKIFAGAGVTGAVCYMGWRWLHTP